MSVRLAIQSQDHEKQRYGRQHPKRNVNLLAPVAHSSGISSLKIGSTVLSGIEHVFAETRLHRNFVTRSCVQRGRVGVVEAADSKVQGFLQRPELRDLLF